MSTTFFHFSVWIPPVNTGAVPSGRHTAAASAAHAATKTAAWTSSPAGGPHSHPGIQDPSGSWCRLSGRLHPGDHTLYAFPCCVGRQVAAWAVQLAHQGGCHVSISCGGEVDGVAFRPDRQA